MRRTIRRDKLMRDIKKGLIEGKVDFHYGYDDATYDFHGKKTDPWIPVSVIKDNKEWKEGKFQIPEWKFKSKSGFASKDDKGIIHFASHSNEGYSLRYKKRKVY